jgi:hypothetical protein
MVYPDNEVIELKLAIMWFCHYAIATANRIPE